MKKFAVALYFKRVTVGTITSTQERLWQKVIEASNIDEALGKAIRLTDEELKNYDLILHLETEIT